MKPIMQGYVTMVLRKYFWCRLGKPGDKHPDYEAQVEIEKLLPRERKRLQEGAYIVLLKGGTWRFLRIKPFTQKEIKAVKARAAKRFAEIGWR